MIGTTLAADPNNSIIRGQVIWHDTNTADGVYNWSKVDGLIANAKKNNKQLGLDVRVLDSAPDFLLKLPGVKTYTGGAAKTAMVLPWDSVVQPYIVKFIIALCQKYDGQVDYLYIGGCGWKTETYIPLPTDIGLTGVTESDELVWWSASSMLIIDTYNANLKSTPFVLATGNVTSDALGQAAITDLINYGLKDPLFGLAQWGLTSTSKPDYFLNAILTANAASHLVIFQDGTGGRGNPDLSGTLALALAWKAHVVELYYQDASLAANTATLAKYNGELK